LWRHYFEGSQAIIWLLDSNDPDRFEEAREEVHKLLQSELLRSLPILILANKQDLPSRASVAEITQALAVGSLGRSPWKVQPCVATTGDCVFEGLEWLANALKDPRPV